MVQSSAALSSLYTSGQCLLSVLGSVGVILLFAGIPQLIYASHVSPGSLMTFLLGALFITLMVTGNAFIGYKYRQLIRERREIDSRSTSFSNSPDDKPPSYDDLLKQDGLPPSYAAVIEKPPRYEEFINEAFNWKSDFEMRCGGSDFPCQPSSSSQAATAAATLETPIIVPIHNQLTQQQRRLERSRQETSEALTFSCTNPAFEGVQESLAGVGGSSGVEYINEVPLEDISIEENNEINNGSRESTGTELVSSGDHASPPPMGEQILSLLESGVLQRVRLDPSMTAGGSGGDRPSSEF